LRAERAPFDAREEFVVRGCTGLKAVRFTQQYNFEEVRWQPLGILIVSSKWLDGEIT